MTTPSTEQIVRTLTHGDQPRVWSLLVTVFGDLAREKGAKISGYALGQLAHAIGIKPEALRVALHRLRKDGWLESHKQGRESHHCFTEWGLAQASAATPKIYGLTRPESAAWLSVSDRAATLDADGAVMLSATTRITAQPVQSDTVFSTPITPDKTVPNWMRDKVCDAQNVSHAQTFLTRLQACSALLQDQPILGDLDVAILRVLVVHGWRRIVLKVPNLPDHVFPKSWAGPACRAQVAKVLEQYPRVDLATLEKLD